ncbi:hypothetical protein PVL29_025105 [Vitis rotundifolia]|uniref:Uncharacterized protein n=3 Tax=Vitis rotundifolia TaxID=103349 RepID=A0AA38YTU8_VITRO|nr:hypothetical protein PVL29_025105 [Vitis rotundifolia]
MTAAGVAVHCYWNGRVKKEKGDVDYEGENVNIMPVKLNYGTTYAELLDKIYTITGIDRWGFELNIICRYPISSREYKPIPIKNDEAVELMLEVPIRSGVYCVEIYLETNAVNKPFHVEANAPANVQISPLSHLLKQECNAVYSNDWETSSKHSNDSPKKDDNQMERRKWEELNMDCLVNVFQKVGMESLLLDVPLVCKSWHKASLDPKCWEFLIFPEYIKPDDIWGRGPFAERLMMEFQQKFSVTTFIKFVIDRSCGHATALSLPICCTEEAFKYAANKCPKLKLLGLNADLLHKHSSIIPKLISRWKNLQSLVLGSSHGMEEILAPIRLFCRNFTRLSAPKTNVGNKEASAIVTSLPNLRYLVLNGAAIERESLVMILQGCKRLIEIDMRDCDGFDEDDAEILKLASHIPSFMCEGSYLYDPFDDYEHTQIGHNYCVYGYGCSYD